MNSDSTFSSGCLLACLLGLVLWMLILLEEGGQMTEYTERECAMCIAAPPPQCRQCHAGLLARYYGSVRALATALAELREARAELVLRRQSDRQMADALDSQDGAVSAACLPGESAK